MKNSVPVFILAVIAGTLAPGAGRAAGLESVRGDVVFASPGNGTRTYERTAHGDFARGSFAAEVTVTLHGGGGAGCAFFGMGRGEASPQLYGEPATAPSVFIFLAPSDFAGGEVSASVNAQETGTGSSPVGDGTHRLRLTWDAVTKRALFEVCRNWDGKDFHADSSVTVNAADVKFGDDGHLFIGGANGDKFSDFSVKPLSAQDIAAAAFGDNFANDPTAGTWLPAGRTNEQPSAGNAADSVTAPVDKFLKSLDGDLRPLACWYNGSHLLATRTFTNGGARTDESVWRLTCRATPVTNRPDALDLNLTFRLQSGRALQAGVAAAFDFADWSTNNYVLIPASVYDGNREEIVGGGYAQGLPRTDLYKKDLQLSVRQLPHLAKELGQPSKVEVLACNAATPAICFFSPERKGGFIVLSEQGIPKKDDPYGTILDNGFSVEESADRSRATLVVSSPGVREQKPEFIGFSASPDRGINLQAGDEIKMHLRIFSFASPDISGLLEKFMAVRKDVTRPNHPRNLIPFSEIEKLETARIDSRFYNGKDSQFYCPENAAWISFGWIGGLMDTYPMLALDDTQHLERVTQTFDFAIPHAQGASGYFYGALNHDGTNFGREGYADPKIVLTRKNADVLFWMVKQFMLLKAQGRADAIKPAWATNIRRLADAFVATWKKDGQWGNFLNVDTGEVVVYNSTSAAQVMGGLALAAVYYHDPEYLKIAEAAADFYYQRDFVKLGMTTGHSADTLQNADADSAAAFCCSLMALYEITGDAQWLEKSRNLANLLATWTVSYDYQLPKNTELGSLGAHLAGVIWASTQNKHGAPGICTSSGSYLFKIYRATGDRRYADLLHDIAHAWQEGMRPDGEITERLTYCDAELRGSRGSGSTGWNELNGFLMALELPGIYLRTDKDEMYVFDSVEAKVVKRDASGVMLQITNPTKYDASVTVFAEDAAQAAKPEGYTRFIRWPHVQIAAGASITVHVSADGLPVEKLQ